MSDQVEARRSRSATFWKCFGETIAKGWDGGAEGEEAREDGRPEEVQGVSLPVGGALQSCGF